MEKLLAKYLSGEASKEEKMEVENWRCESDENAQTFLEMKRIWSGSYQETTPNSSMLNEILSHTPKVKTVSWYGQALKYAAVGLILLVGGYFIFNQYDHVEYPYTVIANENTTHLLPDGSKVFLKKGSSLEVVGFDKQRIVRLIQGKGYFMVEHLDNKPFIVNTPSASVNVLGTTFMVDSDVKETTEVVVESGVVAVIQNPEVFKGNSMKVQLKTGERAELTIGKKGIRKSKNQDENFLAWKTNQIRFRNTRIWEVAQTISDVYDVEPRFDNLSIGNCRLTANYNNKSIEEVITYLDQTFDFKVEKIGNTLVFSGKGCDG